MQRGPRAAGVAGSTHIEAFVGGAEIDIVEAVVMADGGCPRATGIVAVVVPPGLIETTVDLTDIAPVDHIVGLEHLHTEEMEVGGDHIVFRTHTDDVGVGEVGIEHGVAIGAVALVAPPLGVFFDEVGTGVGDFGLYFDTIEVNIAGVAQIKAFGGQVAPHRGFGIGLRLLVDNGVADGRQVGGLYPTLLMDGDI